MRAAQQGASFEAQRELVAREQHKLAARYVGRFKMGAIVPPPLLRELAFALHRRRVAWLVNSRNHDLIDEFFAQAAAALCAPLLVAGSCASGWYACCGASGGCA